MTKSIERSAVSILAAVLMALVAVPAAAAPIENPANGHYYDLIPFTGTWPQARVDALGRSHNGMQGHLVSITSQQENDFLRDSMNIPAGSFIGYYQILPAVEPAGNWVWVTGEAGSFTAWRSPPEPNNAGGGEHCAEWWTPDGTWNDYWCTRNRNAYVIEYEGPSDRTAFAVTKTFSDGRTDEVEVTLTCTTGLPLVQSQTIAGGDPVGVTFVVTDIQGPATCEVTESGGPAGYTPEFNDGLGCSWDEVFSGGYACEIHNVANPGAFTAWKEWNVINDGGDEVNTLVPVTIHCDRDILTSNGTIAGNKRSATRVIDDGGYVEVTVDTTGGAADCYATESIQDSGVESTDNCGTRSITAGGSSSCTFVNTVFFEGIPTLSQYGLALLALLMLGVGLVGFRRFA